MIQKHFEVKSGKNKGFYICIDADQTSKEWSKLFLSNWGTLCAEYNYNFLKHHRLLNRGFYVFTHSKFASHELYKKVYGDILNEFGCVQHPDQREEVVNLPF